VRPSALRPRLQGLRVELEKTFLERLSTSPLKAITELIWDSTPTATIELEFGASEMGGVTTVTVTTTGTGRSTRSLVDAQTRGVRGGGHRASTVPSARA
jgi:hypothetical protein